MTVRTIVEILATHPFFEGFRPDHVELVAGCARNFRFNSGEYLMREGDPADRFYLIRHGMVSLEVAAPGRPPHVITTLHEGDIVGASWLAPPYRAMFDARAVELTRAIGIDARCLRVKCEEDTCLGHEMMKSVLAVMAQRLNATRLQILDVYGDR